MPYNQITFIKSPYYNLTGKFFTQEPLGSLTFIIGGQFQKFSCQVFLTTK